MSVAAALFASVSTVQCAVLTANVLLVLAAHLSVAHRVGTCSALSAVASSLEEEKTSCFVLHAEKTAKTLLVCSTALNQFAFK